MNIKPYQLKSVFLIIIVIFLSVNSLVFTIKAFSFVNFSNDIDYFKGNWKVALRNDPAQSFSWTVKEDLNGSWLNGVVEKDGSRVSTDFWRQNGNKIERFAFSGNSLFVRIESPGWEAEKMILTGTMSDKTGETKIRETIIKINDHQFNALWEKENPDGKWFVFGDEICSK